MIDKTVQRILICLVLSGAFVITTVSEVAAASCDRECLKGFLTQYIEAMIADDLASLPLASNVRFTEDCEEMQPGEGYWREISGTVAFRMDIIDVNRGGAFAFFIIDEGNSYIHFALRLKIADQEITQIETMVVKNVTEGMLFNPENILSTDLSPMTDMPDETLLNTREEMQEMATKYPLGLKNGGTFQSNGAIFTPDAFRLENGRLMAGPGCSFFPGCNDIRTQTLPTLPAMVYKVALVDEEAGIVLIRMNFGEGSVIGASGVLDVFEAFKMYDDSMHVVFAFMQTMPDVSDRSPENLFKWDYDNEVTSKRQSLTPALRQTGTMVHADRGGIVVPLAENTIGLTVRLFDISGKVAFSRKIKVTAKEKSKRIQLPELSAGSYIGSVQYTDTKFENSPVISTIMVTN